MDVSRIVAINITYYLIRSILAFFILVLYKISLLYDTKSIYSFQVSESLLSNMDITCLEIRVIATELFFNKD